MRIIGGKHKGRRLQPPIQAGVRPTTDFARESLINLLKNRLDLTEIHALDLFCGTGAVSFELASHGAKSVTAVDKNPRLLVFIRENAATLELPIHTVRADVFKWIKKNRGTYDLIFVDPPYHIKRHEEIPKFVLESGWLNDGGWLVIEHPREIDFSQHPQYESQRTYGAVHFSFFTR